MAYLCDTQCVHTHFFLWVPVLIITNLLPLAMLLLLLLLLLPHMEKMFDCLCVCVVRVSPSARGPLEEESRTVDCFFWPYYADVWWFTRAHSAKIYAQNLALPLTKLRKKKHNKKKKQFTTLLYNILSHTQATSITHTHTHTNKAVMTYDSSQAKTNWSERSCVCM